MALDFVGIRTEVIDRGFDYLSTGAGLTRLKRWVNAAMHQADRKEDWTYLLTSVTGAQPATLTDARKVRSVVDVARDQPLSKMTEADVVDSTGDLTTTGTAAFWYRTRTGVAVWPVSTASFLTTYYRVAPDLVGDSDVPLMPDEYREIIVELTCRMAWRDSNQYEAAQDCLQAADLILLEMRENLLDYRAFVPRMAVAEDD